MSDVGIVPPSKPPVDAPDNVHVPEIQDLEDIPEDVTAQVRLDSFRQTTVQNFLDSGF